MYAALVGGNRNGASMDSSLALIAAGLTPHANTRQALIQHASQLSGQDAALRGSQALKPNDILNFQKYQDDQKQRLLRQSMLGGLAKQYNLSPESIQFLESSGKLDEVIKHHATQNLTLVEDNATGQKSWADHRGNIIAPFGGPKPEKGEFVTGPQGPELRSPITGAQVAPGVGLPPTESSRTDEAALTRINSERAAQGQPPITAEEYATSIKRESPAADDRARLADINKDRAAKGQPPMSMEEYILLKKPAGTNVYVGQDGTQFRQPPEGYEYERNPDGKVKIGADGKPIMYSASPKAKGEEKETGVDIATKEKAAAEVLKKEHKERVAAKFAESNVGEAVDTALRLADSPGATGTFAQWGRTMSPFKGHAWNTLDSKLKTIDANTVVNALNEMRKASPSGGALGNVTEAENKMLASIIASTDVNQDTPEFKKSMIRIKAAMMVMAENRYDTPDGAARFSKDLKERIDDLTIESINKRGSGVKITPRAKQ